MAVIEAGVSSGDRLDGASLRAASEEGGWILGLFEDPDEYEVSGVTLLLVDSGACIHVCPLTFEKHIPLEAAPVGLTVKAANGKNLNITGLRRMPLWVRAVSGKAM